MGETRRISPSASRGGDPAAVVDPATTRTTLALLGLFSWGRSGPRTRGRARRRCLAATRYLVSQAPAPLQQCARRRASRSMTNRHISRLFRGALATNLNHRCRQASTKRQASGSPCPAPVAGRGALAPGQPDGRGSQRGPARSSPGSFRPSFYGLPSGPLAGPTGPLRTNFLRSSFAYQRRPSWLLS